MKTNRLSEKLSTALNEQMTKHMLLKSTYRMPRGDNNGFAGIANFLLHVQRERT
jgi:ferritin